MLATQLVTSSDDALFQPFWKCYEASFPVEEKRKLTQQIALFDAPNYHVSVVQDATIFIGFITYWKFETMTFVEHFAVDTTLRGKRYGSRMMENFIAEQVHPILLEVELPLERIAQKRIEFYENIGFKLNQVEYLQPAYQTGQHPIPLYTMTYPSSQNQEATDQFTAKFHPIIYSNVGQ